MDPRALRAAKLRCEYQENPLGVDVPRPRLSWALVSDEPGQRQTAYRIVVASSEEHLADGGLAYRVEPGSYTFEIPLGVDD